MKAITASNGFTLLEVLVAMSIMAIALVGVMKSVLLIQDALYDSTSQTLAARLADNQLARIKQDGIESMLQYSGRFENDPTYRWEMEKRDTGAKGLSMLRLSIFRTDTSRRVLVLEELFREPKQ